MDVIKYISDNLLSGADYLGFIGKIFGCSALSAKIRTADIYSAGILIGTNAMQ